MSNEELKEAFFTRRPIVLLRFASLGKPVYTEYAYISAIIYRMNTAGKLFTQAECMDNQSNSVTIANPQQIFFKEELNNG